MIGTPSLHVPMWRCRGVSPSAYSQSVPEKRQLRSASKTFQQKPQS